jgi:hypothetical protein
MELVVFLHVLVLLEILECKIELNNVEICLGHLDRVAVRGWLC